MTKFQDDLKKIRAEGEVEADEGLQAVEKSNSTLWIIIGILAFIGLVVWFIGR